MDFSVKIEGLDKLAQNSKALQQAVEEEIGKGLYASANLVAGDAKRSILEGGKSGRTYTRRTVTHRASAPGEPPASDTGRLVTSISAKLESKLSAVAIAGNSVVKYARMLEFGTSRMSARPFFLPALEKNRRAITDRLKQALASAIRRSGR